MSHFSNRLVSPHPLAHARSYGLRAWGIIAVAIGCGLSACGRRDAAAPAANAPAEHDPRRAAREAMFGAEALTADVTWRDSGLGYRVLAPGAGPKPGIGATVRINYVGRLKDGAVFDRSAKPVDMQLGRMVAGLSTGLQLLAAGGKAVVYVPPSLGYGGIQVMGIPPNSGLIFEVELVAVNP